MKTFEITRLNNAGTSDEYVGSVMVSDYPDYAVGDPSLPKLINPNEKITDATIIRIVFNYPLSHKVKLLFTSKGGFTRLNFFRAIHRGYSIIYREEDEDSRHGIWPHAMEDLFIEGIIHDGNDVYRLSIGS